MPIPEVPRSPAQLEKLPTHIDGFDHVAGGGLPLGRTTLVAGSAGSCKSVFAAQFLAAGIRHAGEAGVFVTFEESVGDLRRNMTNFGWDIAGWERDGKWTFIDAALDAEAPPSVIGEFDFNALIARIEHAVKKTGSRRLSMDSLGAVFSQFADRPTVRRELYRVGEAVKRMGVTAVMTAERSAEYGDLSQFGVEEFVADNVVVLRNNLSEHKRRRTLEILKYRGTFHHKGEYPFTVVPDRGIVIIPLSAIELTQQSSNERMTSGSADLDTMCGGGFFRDSIVLVSGATGTGKTLMATEFIAGGAKLEERSLLFAFEESRQQLFRNASGWGVDLPRMESDGLLRVCCEYPEAAGMEDHLIRMKEIIEEYRPRRVAVDSLSALERVSSVQGFREFVIWLTSYIKQQQIAGLFTATSPNLFGGTSVTDEHISTITDSIILLRYVEIHGVMRRGVMVLKMRGSGHDKDIREFLIDSTGMRIGRPFREISGILSGRPRQAVGTELDHIHGLYPRE
jgi:circadian clock protein KaiC